MRYPVIFAFLFVCAVSWKAHATPETRAVYITVTGFLGCMLEKACSGETLVHGEEIKKNIKKIRERQTSRSMKVIVGYLTSGIVSKKYRRSKARLHEDLKRAGYDTRELDQLGQEKAIVHLGPHVAMASAAVMILRKGEGQQRRMKVEHFYVILWNLPKLGWRVVFLEDFPARWMSKNKPPQMQGK